MKDNFIYDIETFPNIFTIAVLHVESGNKWMFEISDRKNDLAAMCQLCKYIAEIGGAMIGYNNLFFDYSLLHQFLTGKISTSQEAYRICQEIIVERSREYIVWDNKRLVIQIDLLRIYNFDRLGVSLKLLEFNMGMESIQELPFEVGTTLTHSEKDVLIVYNWHDIEATRLFFELSRGEITFREELTAKYGIDFMNSDETKIGEDFFISKLEEVDPQACYIKAPGTWGRGTKRQTPRPEIDLSIVPFDYIKFERPEFNKVKDFITSKTITETKGVFKGLSAVVDGFSYDFGLGGIHASIESMTVYSDDEKIIVDLDVESYYPRLGIVNKMYPAHLGELFYKIYGEIFDMRKMHKKGTRENKLFKLCLNGAFGKTNSKYSTLYDPLYTMKTTLNGQFMLCMLAEQLIKIPGLSMVQCNTDGVTVLCPKKYILQLQLVRSWWEKLTGLNLEHNVYTKMFIRDVNNYAAEYYDIDKDTGERKIKRVGAYEYNKQWHKNFSQKIVAKVTEEVLIRGGDTKSLVLNHPNHMDFFLRTKLKEKSNYLELDGVKVQRVSRYYVAKKGGVLIKHSPPTIGFHIGDWKIGRGVSKSEYHSWNMKHKFHNQPVPYNPDFHTKSKTKYEARETAVCSGYKVVLCNDSTKIDRDNIDYDYYINEVNKLVTPVRGF